jgi:hypothetical protein
MNEEWTKEAIEKLAQAMVKEFENRVSGVGIVVIMTPLAPPRRTGLWTNIRWDQASQVVAEAFEIFEENGKGEEP